MFRLTTTLGGLPLTTCVYNASGVWCTTLQQLVELDHSAAGAVLTKSCTWERRRGHAPPKYYYDKASGNSVNSNGLTNLGYQFYASVAEKIASGPYIVSVSTLDVSCCLSMIETLGRNKQVQGIEINLSCPNVDTDLLDLGHNFKELASFLEEVNYRLKTGYPWGVKLPPYFKQEDWKKCAEVLTEAKPAFVVACNSLPNGMLIDSGRVAIFPKGGLGGAGGACMKPIALANVRQLRQLLPDSIDIVGCGGVFAGQDAFELLLAGASAVQVGTALMEGGPEVLSTIALELDQIMEREGYDSVSAVRSSVGFATPAVINWDSDSSSSEEWSSEDDSESSCSSESD